MKFISLFTLASALNFVSAAPASPIAMDVAVDMTQAGTGDHLFKRRTCPPFLLRAQKTGTCNGTSCRIGWANHKCNIGKCVGKNGGDGSCCGAVDTNGGWGTKVYCPNGGWN